jgi:hypothetical protein
MMSDCLIHQCKAWNYSIELSYVGYIAKSKAYLWALPNFLNIPAIEIQENKQLLGEVVVTAWRCGTLRFDKNFSVDDNISQKRSSVLQAMHLPGVTVQDGKVNFKRKDKICGFDWW